MSILRKLPQVLMYGNRKIDPVIIDASTLEKEAAAFLKLFQYLDRDWQVYDTGMTAPHKALYDKAKAGDAEAAKKLLTQRKGYEYEEWYMHCIFDPLVDDLR